MYIAHLSDQQVDTLFRIAAYLLILTLAIGTAAIAGTIRRLNAAKRRTPSAAELPRTTYQAPANEVSVAA